MEPKHLEQLETMTGPGLRLLLENKQVTEEHLNDPEPKMRRAALTLMTYHWGSTEQFKGRCEEMVLRDPDATVRSTAISCLGTCFSGTDNRRIVKLLADVVCNESETYKMRRSAYLSLLIVSMPPERMPRCEVLANLRIPEDVDWTFVHEKLTGEG
jgi:hypothetical protein